MPVLWGSTLNDWHDMDPGERLHQVLQGSNPGTIVLGHDGFAGPCDGVDDGPEPTLDRAAFLSEYLDEVAHRGLLAVSLERALADSRPVLDTWLRSARSVTTPESGYVQ